jgi:hypothetical protein
MPTHICLLSVMILLTATDQSFSISLFPSLFVVALSCPHHFERSVQLFDAFVRVSCLDLYCYDVDVDWEGTQAHCHPVALPDCFLIGLLVFSSFLLVHGQQLG